jgi:RNA recognition motif-containing protein
MIQVRAVFLDGLPPSWDEDRVKKYLKKYGAIEKVELARNMPAAKRKDFGFVTFDTHDNAVACVDGITNSEIGEGDNKVCFQLSLPYLLNQFYHLLSVLYIEEIRSCNPFSRQFFCGSGKSKSQIVEANAETY